MASVSGVVKLSGKRRFPYLARKTIGYKESGNPIYLPIGVFKTRQEGVLALAKIYDKPDLQMTFNMTVKECFNKFKGTWDNRDDFGIKSRQAYDRAFNQIETLHNSKIREVRHTDIQKIIDKDFKDKNGAAGKIKLLFSQLEYIAKSLDLIDKDYSEFVELPKVGAKIIRRIFKQTELDWLFANDNNYYYAKHILIMNYTGMRIGELNTVAPSDVNFNERYMSGGLKTRAGKNRIIPINKKILPYVAELSSNGTQLLALDEEGKPMTYRQARRRFDEVMEAMGAEHTPHDCRHTAASMMKEAKIDSLYRKLILGHEIKDITDGIYTHVSPGKLVAEIDKI